VSPELAGCTVPPGMLITLVENAIKHGIEPAVHGGRVDVDMTRAPDGRLLLVVADTGAGPAPEASQGTGVGLPNIRERLALLYGDAAALTLDGNEPNGCVVRIVLPAEVPPPAAASTVRPIVHAA
jgi:sensor histidine kinase YesM